MNDQEQNLRSRRVSRSFCFIGLGSLVWLLLRSGTKLRRLTYPCQRVALVNSLGFVGYLLSLLGTMRLYHRLKQRITPSGVILCVLALLITAGLQSSSAVPPTPVRASPTLPGWTSFSAVSDVFVVTDVPVPQCSLDGGTLPGTPPCNNAEYALHDDGIDALVNLMESRGTHFYQTPEHPDGIVGANDVVVIKVNDQWNGSDSRRRNHTNNDVLKGLIYRIVNHLDGFVGAVVVADNTQNLTDPNWNSSDYNNAEDAGQSYQDVVNAFVSQGYDVCISDWRSFWDDEVNEYSDGDYNDGYVFVEDPSGPGTKELSYPKFSITCGSQSINVSMRYGLWYGDSYHSDQLTLINFPVLKRHGWCEATISWKNLIGFLTTANESTRFGGWDPMHNNFFFSSYGLLGRQIATIRRPDLNVVDAIWVNPTSNTDNSGDAVRQDVLMASTDPFAVDWYASEYVLLPLTGSQGTSAARGGTFRSTTRANQNAAELVWPGGSGSYPYVDLLDTYDGSTPTDDEKNQMNVYVTSPGGSSFTLIKPNGGELWQTGSQYQIKWTFTGTITDVSLSYSTDGFTAISYTIVVSTPNTGVYTWTTPITPSTTTRVRVADAANPTIYDDSDANFILTDTTYHIYLPLILKDEW
jgi:hypothetical protein